ncbi:DNA-methyltransferase [Ralstonia solanacearum]|uniref:DNA-methyltransferase n=1 Tax=Ralstonia solanacearum TaxID=305 RepID=UPI0018691DCA|nr:site-specific DNA-methyltransferase [Ralstonia solanacearum]QOK80894.1 site-specific DNA-methyltransferase [Ralstonia solanacearum]
MMTMVPIFRTQLGELHESDCNDLLKTIEPQSVDLAFADPPFNLGKRYKSNINDAVADHEYVDWCKEWLDGMITALKPGGALLLWNLPKWNLPLGAYLSERLTFRHWIAVDIKYSLPIAGRLYPSHYSLLYFIKGQKPAIFHPDRLPIPCCRHCGGELKDYGGYKSKMNPLGVNISDVWTDIPPVRHAKYKKREANALPLKLMDRIISMASDPGSLILDPFGGSGTTFVAAELLGRRWVGGDLHCEDIVARFQSLEGDRDHMRSLHDSKNTLFTASDIERREKQGRPLSKHYRLNGHAAECECD